MGRGGRIERHKAASRDRALNSGDRVTLLALWGQVRSALLLPASSRLLPAVRKQMTARRRKRFDDAAF